MIDPKERSGDTDIVSGLRTRGCPACDYILERVLEFFAHWIYDLSENENLQNENAQTHGLCPFHTWQLAAMGSPLGISRGYGKLMKHIAGKLLQGAETQADAAALTASLINDSHHCRVCRLIQKEEVHYLSKMARFLELKENRRSYSASGGLCLIHLHSITLKVDDPDIVRFLFTEAAKHFASLAHDMEHYSMKRAALQKNLLTRAERDAYLRGLISVAGGKQICNQHNVAVTEQSRHPGGEKNNERPK